MRYGNPKPEEIIRIECIDRPTTREPGSGLFEWRYLKEKFTVDFLGLLNELKKVKYDEDQAERIVERAVNFPKVYINLRTGEVTT